MAPERRRQATKRHRQMRNRTDEIAERFAEYRMGQRYFTIYALGKPQHTQFAMRRAPTEGTSLTSPNHSTECTLHERRRQRWLERVREEHEDGAGDGGRAEGQQEARRVGK